MRHLQPARDPTFDSSYGGRGPLRVEVQARVMRRRGPTRRVDNPRVAGSRARRPLDLTPRPAGRG